MLRSLRYTTSARLRMNPQEQVVEYGQELGGDAQGHTADKASTQKLNIIALFSVDTTAGGVVL